MLRILLFFLVAAACLVPGTAFAAHGHGRIVFVPHDVRPISYQQTAEVVESRGFEVLSPPAELFGNTKWEGEPDKIIDWLEKNLKSADAAVLASDTLLYGGLIPSRKHEIPRDVLEARLARIQALRAKYPKVKLYIFSSLMRTPYEAVPGFDEEPRYYETYGHEFFRLTALQDKQETQGLDSRESAELAELAQKIPQELQQDWFGRRQGNLEATKAFMDMVQRGEAGYMVVGRDDNAPLCQTHKENRELLAYAGELGLSEEKFQSLPGIDEFGLLLLTRAVNDLTKAAPKVNVLFPSKSSDRIVPAYSDEPIGLSIESSIIVAGGRLTQRTREADLVLMVNVDRQGGGYAIHNCLPQHRVQYQKKSLRQAAEKFAEAVQAEVKAGRPVGIADIKMVNGADDYLMQELYDRGLLYKLKAYSGWNTATNSSGFAVGLGMLSKGMKQEKLNRLLTTRYLDDWAYQANVRTEVADQLANLPDGGRSYYSLGTSTKAAEQRVTELMGDFARHKLPPFDFLQDVTVTLPWGRMFECDIHLGK